MNYSEKPPTPSANLQQPAPTYGPEHGYNNGPYVEQGAGQTTNGYTHNQTVTGDQEKPSAYTGGYNNNEGYQNGGYNNNQGYNNEGYNDQYHGTQGGQQDWKQKGKVLFVRAKKEGRALFTDPRKWSRKKQLIVAGAILAFLALVIIAPAVTSTDNKNRTCTCPGWTSSGGVYFPPTTYNCDKHGNDITTGSRNPCGF